MFLAIWHYASFVLLTSITAGTPLCGAVSNLEQNLGTSRFHSRFQPTDHIRSRAFATRDEGFQQDKLKTLAQVNFYIQRLSQSMLRTASAPKETQIFNH